jgi:hypothetical protein
MGFLPSGFFGRYLALLIHQIRARFKLDQQLQGRNPSIPPFL